MHTDAPDALALPEGGCPLPGDLQSPDVGAPESSPADHPEPVVPDYGGACLSRLVPSLFAALDGAPAAWLPTPIHNARQIVLLVVDGLGWHQLRQRTAVAPTLSGAPGADQPITSVAPSTTACALTSITTGRTPSEHGLVGYRLAVGNSTGASEEILNVLRWTLGTGRTRDARRELPARTYQPFPPFPGSVGMVPVVSRSEFGATGFTAAHLGDSPITGFKVGSSVAVGIRNLVALHVPFVYAYYDGIDKVAHEHGLGDYYDAELGAVDRLVADIAGSLPDGAVLVVTADHGQVEVANAVELVGPELTPAVRFLSGEGRFRWLHARPGAADDLFEAAVGIHAASSWVLSRAQLVDDGWFGGPLRDGVADRLGDVALIPHAPIAFLDPADTGESRLVGRHGSLTPDEMHVPLLALTADGNI